MIWIRKHTFLIILFSVVNLVLTPLVSRFLGINGDLMAVINFTIVTLVSILSTDEKLLRNIIIGAAGFTLISVWREYMGIHQFLVFEMRLITTLLLFCTLTYILIRNIFRSEKVNLKVIFGAMAGYILIGLIGGTLFEMMEYNYADSFRLPKHQNGYDFYYYSFISLITVGYGDIVPQSPQAKSLTIILGIIGQFYMAIGVALFVGKHLNEKNTIQEK